MRYFHRYILLRDAFNNIVDNVDDELVKLSSSIAIIRNDINHFGFTSNTMSYDSLNTKIKELYEEFLKYVDINSIE